MHEICPLCSPWFLPFPFGSFQVNWLRCVYVRDALTHRFPSRLISVMLNKQEKLIATFNSTCTLRNPNSSLTIAIHKENLLYYSKEVCPHQLLEVIHTVYSMMIDEYDDNVFLYNKQHIEYPWSH